MTKAAEIKTSIHKLADTLRRLAPEMDKVRRLPATGAEALVPSSMFRLLTPESLAGPELPPAEFFEVLELIAVHNASAAWCSMIASTNAVTAAYLPQEEAQLIFGDPDVITGGVFAPRGKAVDHGDHYRVSGRWAWGSGSANCRWLAGGCLVSSDGEIVKTDDGRPDIRMMIFPTDQVEFHDSWHVMGLRGTGSGDFEVSDLKVPKSRSISLVSDRPRAKTPLYKFPVFGLLAIGITGVAVGNGRAAIQKIKSLGERKSLTTKGYFQKAIGKMETDWMSSRQNLIDEIDKVWNVALSPNDISLKNRAALRLACTHATRKNSDICRRVYELGGGDALFEKNGIERCFRDAFAMTQHIMVGEAIYEIAGRIMLDIPTDTSLI